MPKTKPTVNLKAHAVTKVAGSRRAAKPKPKPDATTFYKDVKTAGLFAKKLANYRFVICTDMEPDAMAFLTLFTAWIKANEKFFDKRSNFPIHSFIIDGSRVKAQRAREFLHAFAETLQWSDPEHDLYKGYITAGSRIWYEDREVGKWDGEQALVNNKDALGADNYPDPVDLTEGIPELLKTNPENLFFIYLKPPRFLENREFVEYLCRAAGAIYGGSNLVALLQNNSNPKVQENLTRFLNRTSADAPLVYCESFFALGTDHGINVLDHPTTFAALDDAEPPEFAQLLRDTMTSWNDARLEAAELQLRANDVTPLPDFTDPDSIDKFAANLDNKANIKLAKRAARLVRYHSQYLAVDRALVFIAMLLANKSLAGLESPFVLKPSRVDYSGEFMFVTSDATSRTMALLPKSGEVTDVHVRKAKKAFCVLLRAAVQLVDY